MTEVRINPDVFAVKAHALPTVSCLQNGKYYIVAMTVMFLENR